MNKEICELMFAELKRIAEINKNESDSEILNKNTIAMC